MAKNNWEIYFDAVKVQNWEKAIVALNLILKKEPDNPQVHLKVGDVLQKAGDMAGAVKAYHQSAWLLMKEGFFQKALAIYKIILRLDPNNSESINKSKELLLELESSKMKPSMPSPLEPGTGEKNEAGALPGFEPAAGVLTGREEDKTGFGVLPEEKAGHGFSEKKEFEEPGEEEAEFDLSKKTEFAGGTGDKDEEDAMWKDFGEEPEPARASEPEPPAEAGFGETGGEFGDGSTSAADDFFGVSPSDELAGTLPEHEPGEEAATEPGQPVPLFLSSMPDEERRKLVESIDPAHFSPGQTILMEGDSGDSVFLLKSGSVRVVAHILGKEIELAVLSPGDVFGEVAFLTGRPRTASVVAADDVEVIEFDRLVLEDVFDRYPDTLKKLEDFYQYHLQDTLGKVKTRMKR